MLHSVNVDKYYALFIISYIGKQYKQGKAILGLQSRGVLRLLTRKGQKDKIYSHNYRSVHTIVS